MDRINALKSIAAEASRGELVFPTSARMALKIKEALDDPECPIDQAARLVQAEPLLAARVVAMANSVTYNPMGREVTDTRTGITRLGFRTVRSLAMALATRQMAGILDNPEHHAIATQLWEHTAHVAALSRVIAKHITKQDPETALFAGIVHEIGSFYLLSRAKDFPGLLDGEPADLEAHGEAEIGRAVLKALDVPAPVLAAMEELWHGYLALPPRSLGDTLLLANDLAPVESPMHQFHQAGTPLPAAMIDSVIGEASLLELLSESREEVDSLTQSLRF